MEIVSGFSRKSLFALIDETTHLSHSATPILFQQTHLSRLIYDSATVVGKMHHTHWLDDHYLRGGINENQLAFYFMSVQSEMMIDNLWRDRRVRIIIVREGLVKKEKKKRLFVKETACIVCIDKH